MADIMYRTGMWDKKNYVQCLGLMMTAQAKGIHPAEANERFHVMVDGKVTPQAWHIQAVFQSRGGRIVFHRSDEEVCDATFTSRYGIVFRCAWDTDRAMRAGLLGKDTWKKHPGQMKRARCITEGIRATDPESVGGMYIADEYDEYAPEESPNVFNRPSSDTGTGNLLTPSSTPPTQDQRPLLPPAVDSKEELGAARAEFRADVERIVGSLSGLERGVWLNRSLGREDGCKDAVTLAMYRSAIANLEPTVREFEARRRSEAAEAAPPHVSQEPVASALPAAGSRSDEDPFEADEPAKVPSKPVESTPLGKAARAKAGLTETPATDEDLRDPFAE